MLKFRESASALTAAPLASELVLMGAQLVKSVEASRTTMLPTGPAILNSHWLSAGSTADFVTDGAWIATNCIDWMVKGASLVGVAATVTVIKSDEAAPPRSSVVIALKVCVPTVRLLQSRL